MKTNLTWKDLGIVAVGHGLSTWVGETIPVVIVGVPKDKVHYGGNDYPNPEIHIFPKGTDRFKAAEELGGVPVLAFLTPKIKQLLDEK
jgi:hypothetical protein